MTRPTRAIAGGEAGVLRCFAAAALAADSSLLLAINRLSGVDLPVVPANSVAIPWRISARRRASASEWLDSRTDRHASILVYTNDRSQRLSRIICWSRLRMGLKFAGSFTATEYC